MYISREKIMLAKQEAKEKQGRTLVVMKRGKN